MRTVLHEESGTLRYAVGIQNLDKRTSGGVLIWDDIPAGVVVSARVSRPAELNEASDGGAGAAVPNPANYRFDLAPPPGPFSHAGVIVRRSQQRLLVTNGLGALTPLQLIPAFAVFAPVQDGGLFQSGRKTHTLQMPGFTGAIPDLDALDRNILRMRWTGTVVAGEAQNARLTAPESGAAVTPDGARKRFAGTLVNRNIAPGSVVIHATIGAALCDLRDDGNGRLTGARIGAGPAFAIEAQGDGTIDYRDGTFLLSFGTPAGGAPDAASAITADYEHGSNYLPLDIHIEWESELQ